MRRLVLFSIFSLVLMFGFTTDANAKDVRVGLVTFYGEVNSVELNNKSLNIGYYTGKFSPVLELNSSGQFVATAYKGSLYISDVEASESDSFNFKKIVKDGKVYYCDFADSSNDDIKFSKINTNEMLKLSYDGKEVYIDNSGKRAVFSTYDLRNNLPLVYVGKRAYRGFIEVDVEGEKVTAINIIDMEKYLYSVVCSEVISSWPEHCLKSQAVAARTYATYYCTVERKYKTKEYDVNDTMDSQVYKGYNNEVARVRKAVNETAGVMIYYKNRVIPAFFFSTSGGMTESSKNVWSVDIPYLKAVPDIVETKPERKPWVIKYTKAELAKRLAKRNIDVGEVQSIKVKKRSESDRVMELEIKGSRSSVVLKKEKIRYALGLYSRRFEALNEGESCDKNINFVTADKKLETKNVDNLYVVSAKGVNRVKDSKKQIIMLGKDNMFNKSIINGKSGVVTFVGTGWGHGVGMSQSGSRCMAEQGYTYQEILKHYYQGVEVR